MRTSSTVQVPFPTKGLVESTAKREQPTGTSVSMQNMMSWGPASGRNRGAQRAGLIKYCPSQISGSNRVQDINQVTSVQTGITEALTSVQIRQIYHCAVSDGDVALFDGSSVTAATSGSGALLSSAPVIFSAEMFGELYFADGTNTKKWTASTNTVSNWTASAGVFPVSGSDYPRLIEFWNGRIVMSGIASDPHNWFMSAIGDATDFDYTPTPEVDTQAVAGNQGPIGKIGDVVTSLVPYSDDVLLFGCDHHIYQMTGDPASGGRIDMLTDVTGMAWGRPYCRSNTGTLYFIGSRGGFYRLVPGSQVDRISLNRVEERFNDLDMNTHLIRMAWDDEDIGAWIFVTSLETNTTLFYFYDERNDAIFPMRFGNPDHNPVAVHISDGDTPEDRVVMMGSDDGYIRTWSESAKNDDGTAIESFVILGPIIANEGELPVLIQEMQAILSSSSDAVSYDVYVGDSAEAALALRPDGLVLLETSSNLLLQDGSGFLLLEDTVGSPHRTGTFPLGSYGRSPTIYPRSRGFAVYVKLYNTASSESWELERLRLKMATVTTSKGRR